MPRHKQLRTCHPVGVSFSPEDIDWLRATYGKRHSTTDLVRCAIHEARCWRAGSPHPIPPPMAEPPAKINIEDWHNHVRICDIPEDPEPHGLPPGGAENQGDYYDTPGR